MKGGAGVAGSARACGSRTVRGRSGLDGAASSPGVEFARAIEGWFARRARRLPWRVRPRDPYLSLVSEFMLQQTQVARVLEKFGPFVGRFPTVEALAHAPESDVLAQWSGLGYYRRARLLHAAARAIVSDRDGKIPRDADALRALPGVGRYTAGAIASIVFGAHEPIVDGNVARVLLRVHGRPMETGSAAAMNWAWGRAGELVERAKNPARFNEGLMELGAVVCTAKSPRCESCPVRAACAARAQGMEASIPRARRRPRRAIVQCDSVVILDGAGRVAVQQRPARGMWASMWQAPTVEHAGERSEDVGRRVLRKRYRVAGLTLADRFVHVTSHREFRVRVWRAEKARAGGDGAWAWREPRALVLLAMSNLQRRVLASVVLGTEDAVGAAPSKVL